MTEEQVVKYAKLHGIANGIARVFADDEWFYIDKEGNRVG